MSRCGRESPRDPRVVADTWDDVAFLEAVKCTPNRPRATPYAEMWPHCIDLLLIDELRLLEPAVVLLLGRSELRDSVRPVLRVRLGLTWGEHPGALERDTFVLYGRHVILFSVNHSGRRPSWHRSYRQLVTSLRNSSIQSTIATGGERLIGH